MIYIESKNGFLVIFETNTVLKFTLVLIGGNDFLNLRLFRQINRSNLRNPIGFAPWIKQSLKFF